MEIIIVTFATCKYCAFAVPGNVPELREWGLRPNFVNRAEYPGSTCGAWSPERGNTSSTPGPEQLRFGGKLRYGENCIVHFTADIKLRIMTNIQKIFTNNYKVWFLSTESPAWFLPAGTAWFLSAVETRLCMIFVSSQVLTLDDFCQQSSPFFGLLIFFSANHCSCLMFVSMFRITVNSYRGNFKMLTPDRSPAGRYI
jgi:hypothetical protein